MESKIRDLLTNEEKVQYYERVLEIQRGSKSLTESEKDKLFKEASNILLVGVDREIARREELKLR